MNKTVKIVLIAVLLGGSIYLYNTEFSSASSTEVLDGYNEEEAEANFEAVKDQFPQAPAGATAGVNPPHGQPGHRCDIPVGSSLDAPLKTTNNNGLLNAGSATAMKNPPHGQPGHRCDLAVGAPLPQ